MYISTRVDKYSEIAHWVKVLAAVSDALSSIPRTHIVNRKLNPAECHLTSTSMI